MITIYGSDGMAKTQVPCDDNSTQEMELQGDNALSLSFTLYEHVALEVNDYAEFMGQRSTGSWNGITPSKCRR